MQTFTAAPFRARSWNEPHTRQQGTDARICPIRTVARYPAVGRSEPSVRAQTTKGLCWINPFVKNPENANPSMVSGKQVRGRPDGGREGLRVGRKEESEGAKKSPWRWPSVHYLDCATASRVCACQTPLTLCLKMCRLAFVTCTSPKRPQLKSDNKR